MLCLSWTDQFKLAVKVSHETVGVVCVHVQTPDKYFVKPVFIRRSIVTSANVNGAHDKLVTLHFDNTLAVSSIKLDLETETVEITVFLTTRVFDEFRMLYSDPIRYSKACLWRQSSTQYPNKTKTSTRLWVVDIDSGAVKKF